MQDYARAARLPRSGRHLASVDRAALGPPAPADGAGRPGPAAVQGRLALARQIAWRDFFADTLFHRPDAVTEPIRPEFTRMPTDEPEPDTAAAERLKAWQQGQTGYPLVDAGMRQLLAEGWMHNRVRMVVASFLIKDLHIGWWHGADWFMAQLRDGDIAQNQLNWQWVAGCGTDPAPYFRIFNPTTSPRSSTRMGATSGATSPSWPMFPTSTCTSHGRHRTALRRGIRSPSSITRPSVRRLSTLRRKMTRAERIAAILEQLVEDGGST